MSGVFENTVAFNLCPASESLSYPSYHAEPEDEKYIQESSSSQWMCPVLFTQHTSGPGCSSSTVTLLFIGSKQSNFAVCHFWHVLCKNGKRRKTCHQRKWARVLISGPQRFIKSSDLDVSLCYAMLLTRKGNSRAGTLQLFTFLLLSSTVSGKGSDSINGQLCEDTNSYHGERSSMFIYTDVYGNNDLKL